MQLLFNTNKYIFVIIRCFTGHIVCKEGLLVDPAKIVVIRTCLHLVQYKHCGLLWGILGITDGL